MKIKVRRLHWALEKKYRPVLTSHNRVSYILYEILPGLGFGGFGFGSEKRKIHLQLFLSDLSGYT